MQRVVVISNSGGGKFVLARRVAERFALPYVEIGWLLWRKGWRLNPEGAYRSAHKRILAQGNWVIDGKVARETQYFADPFESGPLRAQWVERVP